MLSEEIMIVPRHLSETIGREGHNHFRRIDIAVLLIRTRTYQCHERMLLRAGDAAHRSCALPSISKLSPLNMTFPCPGTIQRDQLEIPIIHIKCCAQHPIHRQRIFSLVLQNYASCDHILLIENRIQKLC